MGCWARTSRECERRLLLLERRAPGLAAKTLTSTQAEIGPDMQCCA